MSPRKSLAGTSESMGTGTAENRAQEKPNDGGVLGQTDSSAILRVDDSKIKLVPVLANASTASLSLVPQFPDKSPSGGGQEVLLPEIHGWYENLRSRLAGISNLPPQVSEELIEQFKSIIVIVMGKRLGGVLGLTTTEEGHRRCEAAVEYIPTIHALAPNAQLIVGASGHREEGEMFTAHVKELLNKRQFDWRSSVNFFTERHAKNTFENVLFSRAEIRRSFNPPSPRLWVVSSSDNHLGSLLLKDRSLPPEVTELGLLRQSTRDATAFLFAPYPYRGGDPGMNWLCRIIDIAFLAAPLQANLYGIRNGVPKKAQWDNKNGQWKGRGRIRLQQIYENPVALLEFLIRQLQHDRAPLTEYKPETQCAYLVAEVRKNVDSVLGPLKKIHSELRRVQGLKNGSDFKHWHGVDLQCALEWINKLVARLRWFADIEASDADREKVRQQY